MTSFTRRKFLAHSGVGLLAFHVAGCEMELTPREARERGADLRVLSGAQAECLGALGEILVPGSRAAGLAHFVDHQLAAPPEDQMLMIRYLGVRPPYTAFYQDGLAALERAAQATHRSDFTSLDAPAQRELVAGMAGGNPEAWGDGPPPGLFYFVARNDAIDVTYGTAEGFEALGIPYRAHIQPPSRWGE
jgi:hypothetical protein